MELLSHFNALKAYRDLVFGRIEFYTEKYTSYKKLLDDIISTVKELLYRSGVILVFFSAISWISTIMYVIFYYTYMPNVTHIRPVHLQVKACGENMGVCAFPSAHVQLTRRSQLLMSSQPYRVKLVMEVPETQINKDLGMFMVCAQMRAAGGELVSSSCRSTMLKHRSMLHHVMRTLVYAPLLVSGYHEEIQPMHVELFTDFKDDQRHPVTHAYVELQSRFVQVISSELHIEAHFTGLRYIMYYRPMISALIVELKRRVILVELTVPWETNIPRDHTFKLNKYYELTNELSRNKFIVNLYAVEVGARGICTNLFFVSLLFILSCWYRLRDGLPDYLKGKLAIEIKDEKIENESKPSGKVKLEREDSFPFIEEEFQELEEIRD